MKTRDRILHISLQLFNDRSERSVTTNHIAAELNMSPGNLYYHFRNKEAIIFELFLQYEQRTREFLIASEEQAVTWQDIMGYFQAIARNIWDYRFLHRDMEQLLNNDEKLLERYRIFAQEVMRSGRHIMHLMKQSALIEATEDELDALIINTWVITTSWAPFLHSTAVFGHVATDLNQDMIKRGIRQVIHLLSPYLRGPARDAIPDTLAYYS